MIKSLTIEQKDELEEIFGFSRGTPCGCPRVSFDFIDCSLYSHDIASIPSLVEKIIIKTPKAVVQPINSEEIIKLIKFAHKNQIHLTPRGAGTSGYGGVIPILGGIIVDFSRMNKVINIDPNNLTVTVEPGIRWKDLENIIKPYGLALCTYPSSGLASTVGGWLAQGGTGFGGYEHGFFIHSVKSATLITPDCQKQEFTESDLYKVSDLEGITGFITQVVLKLKKYSDVKLAISAFPNVETMIQAITNINEQKIPLWHMAYESPLYIKYLMQLNNSKMYPPDKYILICGYHADLENVIKYQLIKTFNQNQGEILSDETASSHWNSRWYPMRIKRLGPSMISSEIIIDFKHLEEFLKKITNSIPEMSIHGSIVKDNKAIALGFALDDERNPEFTNNNKKSLQMIELAESFGGRVYNLGMYFHDKAHSVLGENRYNSIKEYKQKIDPHDIFNPGKVILMKGEHDASTHLKSAIRASHFMGNSLSSIAGTLLSQKIKLPDNFPEKIFDEAFICSSCGFCRTDCPIYNATYLEKFSPRGKFNIIKQITKNNMDYSQEIADIFSFCTTCGKCETHCQTKIPIFECWNIIKAHFAEEKKFLGFSILDFMAAAQEATGNIWGIPGDQRIKKIISNSANSDTLFWAGCTLSIRTDEADDINIILNKAKINFKTSDGSEECCGLLLLFWGHKKRADNLFGKNIENFNAQGIKTIVTSCASCYLAFKKYYPVFASQSGLDWKIDVLHISELINNQIEKQILNFNNSLLYNLTYHDPCYLGKHANLYDPPRKTLKSIPGVKLHEMDSSQDESLCCGNLITRINNSIVSGDIANNLIKAGNDIKASSMVTACHFCEMQLDFANDKNFDCISFVSLIRQALEPDYKPESLALIPYEYINLFQQITQNLNYFIVLDIINGNIKDIINPIPMAIKKARDEVKKASILSRISSNVRMEKAVNENIPIIIKEKTKQIGELAYNLIFPQILDIPATLQNSFKQIIICYVKQIILKNELKIIEELRPEIMCEIKKI